MVALFCRHYTRRPPKILRVFVCLAFAVWCATLTTCDDTRRRSAENASGAKPVLLAEPNPVPAGNPDQPFAATKITWNTGDGTIGNLYVKIDRADEVFIARAPSGTMKIDWIQFDSRYEFRLYAEKRPRLLAKLEVTRDD